MYLAQWSSGGNTEGLELPWAWLRREIAAKYGVPPFTVDDWPRAELLAEVQLMNLERPYLAQRKLLEAGLLRPGG